MEHTIVLRGLEGNDPISTNAMQSALFPHSETIAALYWVAWALIFLYFFARYVFMPLFKAESKK